MEGNNEYFNIISFLTVAKMNSINILGAMLVVLDRAPLATPYLAV